MILLLQLFFLNSLSNSDILFLLIIYGCGFCRYFSLVFYLSVCSIIEYTYPPSLGAAVLLSNNCNRTVFYFTLESNTSSIYNKAKEISPSVFAGRGADVDYKKLIIEIVSNSNNNELLELIYRFAKKILG